MTAIIVTAIVLYGFFLLYTLVQIRRTDRSLGYSAYATLQDMEHDYQLEDEGEQAAVNFERFRRQALHCQKLFRFIPSHIFANTRKKYARSI